MVRGSPRILLFSIACVLVSPAVAGGDPGEVLSVPDVEHPKAFFWAMRTVIAEPPELLRLVDRGHGLDRDYEPDNLVELSEVEPHIQTTGRHRVTERTADSLSNMVNAARNDGVELVVSSAYRSFARQEALHAYWIDELGERLARALSAPAGHSQHQLGTTVDFAPVGRAFENTPSDRWLREHAWRYGFSLSYPEGYEELTGYNHESWHYRYVGTAASYVEQRFFAGIQQHMLEYLHEHRRELERWTEHNSGDPANMR